MQVRRRILITDDDIDLRRSLADQVALHAEFEVSQASTASEALVWVKDHLPDLVIMDVGLPDMDGRDAVQVMRKDGYRSPIIILTAHSSDADAVSCLELGANDYVLKPFRFAVLLARIRAHLRNYDVSEDAALRIGEYIFKPGSKHLLRPVGAKQRLTEKEAAILKFLYRANTAVVTREVLLRELWGYNSSVTTHTFETHIYRLRQKIEQDPANAQILLTEAGGYKLLP